MVGPKETPGVYAARGLVRWPWSRKSGMAGFASIPRRRVIAKCAKSDNFRVGAFPVAGEPEIGAAGFG